MTRNKRTEVVAQAGLTHLTRHILEKMGPEGAIIRHRLQLFYRKRATDRTTEYEPERRKSA
jgi:hypothetical protein